MNDDMVVILQKRIFGRAALVTIGTFVFNTLGVWLSLYSILWWYDMPLHFFGGLFIGLLSISLLLRFKSFITFSLLRSTLVIVGLVFVFGVSWELYEVIFDIIAGRPQVLLDSFSDICFDLAGGLQAMLIYFRHKRIVLSNNLA